MGSLVKQASTQLALKFFLTASSDHITGLTGATPTVTIRKEGGSFASPAGAVTEIANGWYQVAGNATDTATLGDILLHATAASADPCDMIAAIVVGFDPQAALATPTNITAGTITTVGTLTTYTGNTPQTGDNFARIGAPGGASVSADIAAVNAKTTNLPASPAAVGSAMTLTSGERNSVADALLDRDMSVGTDSGSPTVRTMRQALRFLRNKWAIAAGVLTVTKEDDATASWTSALATDGTALPIVGSDPA